MQGSISFDGTLAGSIAGGGGGDTTPVINADATVDSLSGDPTCTVSRTGTDEMPTFHFAFSGIVGEEGPEGPEGPQGPAGEDGVTPEVTASATVNSSTGTPAVTVTKSGTTAAPNFAFAFSNLKGETGATGATGAQGPAGVGVPSGGATGDVLRKDSTTDYDTYWDTLTALDIPYDNTSSGMTATNTQAAITELKSNLTQLDGLNVVKRITTPASIVSFSDGSNLPIYKLLSSIEPIQDLHGYDNPWAGGAGKNKFGGEYNQFFPLHFSSEMTIIASADPASGTPPQIAYYDENQTLIDYWGMAQKFSSVSNRIARTITYPTTAYYVKFITTETTNYQIEVSSTNTTFAPYSNICPISGFTEANDTISPTLNTQDGTTYNIDFLDGSTPLTVYGGTLEAITGILTITKGYIDSYNGETLPSTWISDRDVYAIGTTPTTGAQVVYELASPITYQLSTIQANSLNGNTNIWTDTGDILEVDYTAILNFS